MSRKLCYRCAGIKTGKKASYCADCYNRIKRDWYAKNRLQEIARCAKYNKENPSVPARSMRRYRERNPERYLKYRRDYRESNKEKFAVWDANKHHKRRAAGRAGLGITWSGWYVLKLAVGFLCVYCGKKKKLTMDHMVPLSRGGEHSMSNIVPSCINCNSSKGNKTREEFRSWKKSK